MTAPELLLTMDMAIGGPLFKAARIVQSTRAKKAYWDREVKRLRECNARFQRVTA